MVPGLRLRRLAGFLVSLGFSLSAPLAAQAIWAGNSILAASAKACQPFFPSVHYLAGTGASSPAIGDFNGDGKPDLVVLIGKDLAVLLRNNDGTFRQAGSFPTGATIPRTVVAGDFNRDGKLDAAVADANGAVDILLGNGDGTFRAPLITTTSLETDFIAVGDFNHDGNLYLAAVAGSLVEVLLGRGDGTFHTPVDYAVSNTPSSIAVADFNGDGHLDLAVAIKGYDANPGHTVAVFLGRGDGGFRADVEYGVGYEPYAITAADFNGDGKMDIATANYLDGTASVLLNRGNGKFNTASNYATGHPFAPYGITAASWDPGSKPSLALATAAGTFVLVNKGDGTFRPALGYDPPAIQVVSMDLNNDGKADLIVAGDYGGEGNGGLTMLFGKGRGVFTTAASYVAVPNLEAVAVGDFNGDGIPDLAVVDANDRQLAIILGLGKGSFSAPVHYYNAPGYPSAIVAGDFNRDGKLDLAVASDSHQVYLYLGNGDGSFTMGNSFRTLGQYPGWMTT